MAPLPTLAEISSFRIKRSGTTSGYLFSRVGIFLVTFGITAYNGVDIIPLSIALRIPGAGVAEVMLSSLLVSAAVAEGVSDIVGEIAHATQKK